MKLRQLISKFFRTHVFNPEWQCAVCGKENFDGGYVCAECEAKLCYNDGAICYHNRDILNVHLCLFDAINRLNP